MDDGFPSVDPTTVLGALAVGTSRVTLGALVTPLARRRPWKVAKEFVTLSSLSEGRAVLGVGLGDPPEEFTAFGESGDPSTRASKLDEGLEVVSALLSGEQVSFRGRHFDVEARFLPSVAGGGGAPIWVACRWPSNKTGPLRRAARWGAVFPVSPHFSRTSPLKKPDLQSLLATLRPFLDGNTDPDLIHAGVTSAHHTDLDLGLVGEFQNLGVKWWLEFFTPGETPLSEVRARIEAGPPVPTR